jgi:hypothetical protein
VLAEEERLRKADAREDNWRRWGPYLAERQWGTVREDYSPDGECWDYFPHDHARSRAYRWGEDGLLGITDRECRLCFCVALWNERDPILKERLFGLSGKQGNHGEDVKECYYYLDSTPTHSYMKALYKYPQTEFPYQRLIEENSTRDRTQPEYELTDTGVFRDERYFDVFAEYAKAGVDDICILVTIVNRGPDAAPLHVLPTVWFRNTWSWGCKHDGCWVKPSIKSDGASRCITQHVTLGRFAFEAAPGPNGKLPDFLFTENETNSRRLFNSETGGRYRRDAFHDHVVHGNPDAVDPRKKGTKAAAHYVLQIAPGKTVQLKLRLFADGVVEEDCFGESFKKAFSVRKREADAFFTAKLPKQASPEERNVMRQAYAGLLWSKQFYHYVVKDWIEGDPEQPAPPPQRLRGRNSNWAHLFNRDIISMPDKWEYPWYASWDTAFHMLPFAQVDPQFAKDQLLLFLREWYMHPNGQIPAYEFAFGDANPPVHAWAVWRVYKISGRRGERDQVFLARAFHKLLMNFTWWVNRKDPEGRNLFAGGFLGLDNIGVFDRSRPLPMGGSLHQADGTAWMAFYCTTMLSIALELARHDPSYEDVASKFFEHFVHITDAMNCIGGGGLWDDNDGFYYDQIRFEHDSIPMQIRSLVGVIPLLAVAVLDDALIHKLPGFKKRMEWFLDHRKDLASHVAYMEPECDDGSQCFKRLLAIPSRERLVRVLRYLLDENEFLSPYGVRSVSKHHRKHPYIFSFDGQTHSVEYSPGEATTGLFGGNSNWRGPVWFPINYLLIEALERYHFFYGDTLKVECPVGSGTVVNLQQVANELSGRLSRLFLPDAEGKRPFHGDEASCENSANWREYVLFHEYFHGDTGKGLGASHQTGWTALVVRAIEQLVRTRENGKGV